MFAKEGGSQLSEIIGQLITNAEWEICLKNTFLEDF